LQHRSASSFKELTSVLPVENSGRRSQPPGGRSRGQMPSKVQLWPSGQFDVPKSAREAGGSRQLGSARA
jgi:hypothetical protein